MTLIAFETFFPARNPGAHLEDPMGVGQQWDRHPTLPTKLAAPHSSLTPS
eukprot:CAMPEP_0174284264 /NCGR_PEP_ID=MMETSP0809-20121228/5020_1 /TAXON_ID=73025 ORGANISM="Eutreptiella gymnastica-like, Strain CCMP1594" /NCGR_SAMPLE_ID=MMETSP0809 /ASSEMBLY_ACC=CAM_ASM_000658 /LENGTH=49 /DNA_ID= /DNA_START= /DNA_END= /DNA_ORIENTATION=